MQTDGHNIAEAISKKPAALDDASILIIKGAPFEMASKHQTRHGGCLRSYQNHPELSV
jgi:hypothetical protein